MKRLKTLVSLVLILMTPLTLGQLNFDIDTMQGGPDLRASESSTAGIWVPMSPCPALFHYRWWGRDVIGIIVLTPPIRSSLTEPIKLVIALSLEAMLPDKYVGVLELHEDKDVVFSRLQQGDQSPIWYRIRFPLNDPIPTLTKIELNDNVVCQGPAVTPSQSPVTILNLDHTIFPAGLELNVQHQRPPSTQRPPWFPPIRPQVQPSGFGVEQQVVNLPVTNKPPQYTTPQTPTSFEPAEGKCGKAVGPFVLVVDGNATKIGNWPWLAAMFVRTNKGHDFQCGGSLISVNHVITAAHCVKMPNTPAISTDRISVYLGKFHLFQAEEYSQHIDISNVILHPSYGGGKFDNDIAILFLKTSAKFTPYVQPVCLWPEINMSLDNVINKKGTVVGWGRDEKGNPVSEQPKMVTMGVVSQEECLRSHYNFHFLTTNTTYCAGGRDGSGPCSGDSGGGMYLEDLTTPGPEKRWLLRGLVSLSLHDENTKMCDLNNYIVFTDVAKFTPWIKKMTGLV